MIGGGVLGFLLVAFFLFNNLSGGGDDGAIPTLPPITNAPGGGDGGASPSVEPSNGISPQPVFTGRDPFSIPPALATTSATGSGTGTETPPPSSTSTTTPTGTVTPTGPPPSTPGGNSSIVLGGKTVVLLDVFRQGMRADFEVDGTVYSGVGIGDTFGQGGNFELQSISGECATFLYGDEPYTLCANSTK